MESWHVSGACGKRGPVLGVWWWTENASDVTTSTGLGFAQSRRPASKLSNVRIEGSVESTLLLKLNRSLGDRRVRTRPRWGRPEASSVRIDGHDLQLEMESVSM